MVLLQLIRPRDAKQQLVPHRLRQLIATALQGNKRIKAAYSQYSKVGWYTNFFYAVLSNALKKHQLYRNRLALERPPFPVASATLHYPFSELISFHNSHYKLQFFFEFHCNS